MIEDIKAKMLNTDSKHPFSSGDFFKFFKYSIHRNFKRYLDNPKFYKHLLFNEYEKVVSRRAETISMDREIFLQLCKHRKIDTSSFIDCYFQYHKDRVRKSTEYFPNLKKGEKHTLKMYNRPAGKYYSHSLNTINLSDAILADPFDVYKFCVTQLKWRHSAFLASVINSYLSTGQDSIPYLNYDNIDNEYRLSYYNLTLLLLEEYPLSKNQKELLKHYIECIKVLIKKTTAIDHKKRFYKEKAMSLKNKKTPVYVDIKQLKASLRVGAKLFHPDKNPQGLELFKEFNKYYMDKDVYSMNEMIKKYNQIF
ncbi:hypothetical protein JJL45_05100 [Tamlana sp. s12]|uniref:hypothetical protein n=1 Tax=Tamlana sp. s12 TaxID=1630406 RepID=UPI0007FCE753|nr:hypothetical protein [Tamlana sp. s12]OBQ56118.1 hypothetical protein VQ01_06955 [Tamlana sp. s12]QQY83368.1 hypothetical protein JJL45_05100 [Tamlana sp. s12]